MSKQKFPSDAELKEIRELLNGCPASRNFSPERPEIALQNSPAGAKR